VTEGYRKLGGSQVTYATISYWDAEQGLYVDVVSHMVGDHRAEYEAMHKPPEVVVRNVRMA
jgi:hypothetical protein